MRRLLVWLISMIVVLLLFATYIHYGDTTPILDEPEITAPVDKAVDEYVFDDSIGTIGDIGIGQMQKTKFINYDKDNQVEREFGFDKLLSETTDEWTVEKPYVNFYQRNFICRITADSGNIQVENIAGKPQPKDANLSGNVLIKIEPRGDSNIAESRIYLDEVSFASEKSMFITVGSVKFVSENASFEGKGMEIIYNSRLNRLEYFRIVSVDQLTIKTSKAGLFASSDKKDKTKKSKPKALKDLPEGDYYTCTINDDVVITSPDQIIAAETITLDNIFWKRSSSKKSKDKVASTIDAPSKAKSQFAESDEETGEIRLTCKGGIFVRPKDSKINILSPASDSQGSHNIPTDLIASDSQKTTLIANSINFDLSTNNVFAKGPVDLTLYTTGLDAGSPSATPQPLKVTAKTSATFLAESKQAILQGDCRAQFTQQQGTDTQHHRLFAEKLTIDLSSTDGQTDALNFNHLTAIGDSVKLSSTRTIDGQFSGVELKCLQFDYDAQSSLVTAKGPGLIKIDNSAVKQSADEQSKFSMRRPCYVLVENFDLLRYSSQDAKLIVTGDTQPIRIGYFPLVDGVVDGKIIVDAGHIEAQFTDSGEIAYLNATDGIYAEQDKYEFSGNRLFYDAIKSSINITGTPNKPCVLNGVFVEAIDIDPETGDITAEITTPGSFQINSSK